MIVFSIIHGLCALYLISYQNHYDITSRIPAIMYNDGCYLNSNKLKESVAYMLQEELVDDLVTGSCEPDNWALDLRRHGVAHMRYWFGDHFWHVGLPPDFTSAAHKCIVA